MDSEIFEVLQIKYDHRDLSATSMCDAWARDNQD